MNERPVCHCLDPQYKSVPWSELQLHSEPQDKQSVAWERLLDVIDEAAKDDRGEFDPCNELGRELWSQIVTLPATISKLKSVRVLMLYGSDLVRIPPEIGDMESLEAFDPYTSRRLHRFPYEIRRCPLLKVSRVSTREFYGNYKYRPPFPSLPQDCGDTPTCCSVCRGPFTITGPEQRWISLRVATDVMPLLVHACSDECIARLPQPAERYVQHAHRGGLELAQPKRDPFYD